MGSVPNTTTSVNSGTPAFSVAIVGGGIGGVSLALGLLKYPHIDVQVYESAPAFGEIGAGVAFGPNAQRALELIGPSANHAFLKHATPNLWPFSANVFAHHIVVSTPFNLLPFELSSLTFAYQGYGEHSGKLIHSQTNATGMQSVHRAHFLDELIKGVPAHRAHFNKRLTAVEDQKDVVKLSFKDGTSTTVNAVIGADGVHSVVRDHLLGSSHKFAKAAYTGMAVYRGLVSMDAAVEKLGAEFAQNCVILCGPDKAIMSYPIDHGEILNIVFMDFHHGEWKSDKAIIPADREVFKHFVDGWYEKAQGLDEVSQS